MPILNFGALIYWPRVGTVNISNFTSDNNGKFTNDCQKQPKDFVWFSSDWNDLIFLAMVPNNQFSKTGEIRTKTSSKKKPTPVKKDLNAAVMVMSTLRLNIKALKINFLSRFQEKISFWLICDSGSCLEQGWRAQRSGVWKDVLT